MEKKDIQGLSIYIYTFGSLETNTYVFEDSKSVCVIDPANANKDEDIEIIEKIKELGELKYIINTHGHFDHIIGNRTLKEEFKNAKIIIHPLDKEKLNDPVKNGSNFFGEPVISPDCDMTINEGDEIKTGKIKLKVIHTPGHTKGSISLKGEGFIFSGDTLFAGSVGIAKEYSNAFEEMITSIKEKLLVLQDETIVLPGHGGTSKIKEEKELNPFLS
jgi:glyoxylase-like metal-dependent hydrolase (beta-lactamase superfamily II)